MTNMAENSDMPNSGQETAEVSAGAKFLSSKITFEDGTPKAVRMITKDLEKCPVTQEDMHGDKVDVMWAKAEDLEDEPGIEKNMKITSKVLGRKIQSYLMKGIQDLEITKHGKTGFGVTYDVKGLNEPPTTQKGNQQRLK
jgi:hypothetical protein